MNRKTLYPFPKGIAFDRGYQTSADVLTQTQDGRSLNEIWAEFNRILAEWNSPRTDLISLLTNKITNPTEMVPIPAKGSFEEASEYGVPKALGGADFFSMGYPFKWYDLAVRFTWGYLAEATSAQIDSVMNQALEADNQLVFSLVMKALFSSENRIANIQGNPFNVYALYNGDDGVTPPEYRNYTFDNTHNHYLMSGADTVDSQDLDDLLETIAHHGHGSENGATLALLVSAQEMKVIRQFRVANGDAFDFIPSVTGGAVIIEGTILGGSVPPSGFKGQKVQGSYNGILIIENDYIPAGYMFMWSSGGSNSQSNPLGIREHANSALRGLKLINGREDYPLINSYYRRGLGVAVRQRGAAAVMKIGSTGTYEPPAKYS